MSLTIGTKITVLHRGEPLQATIWTRNDGGNENAFTYLGIDGTKDQDGFLFAEDEGVEWLAGWGDDAGPVLLATQALRPEPEMFFGTSTGRWQSQQPNMQNYPRRASGKP